MKPRIFISAVSSELKSARTRVEHALEFLGFEAEHQEIFGTEPGDLRQMLRDKIDSCEGLIQLVGHGYGAEPPEQDAEFGRVSYTQFEFLYARKKGKKTWLVFPGDACTRDTPVTSLDLPRDSAHPDPAAHQAERRALQEAYVTKRHGDGHLRHTAPDDTGLELTIHRLKDQMSELRREFRGWQSKVLRGFTAVIVLLLLVGGGLWWSSQRQERKLEKIQEQQAITTARLRAHLEEASQQALARDRAEAEGKSDWKESERLKKAAEAAHQQRLSRIGDLAAEFARIEASQEATEVFRDLTRIAADPKQGVSEALAYLETKRAGILSSHQAGMAATRRNLQPLLSGAELAVTAGDLKKAEELFSEVLQADAGWAEARYAFLDFLLYTQGLRAESHATVQAAGKVYEVAERHASRLVEEHPENLNWQRELSISYIKLGDVARTQGKMTEAVRRYGEGLAVQQELLSSDPGNTVWQRDLSASYHRLGDVAKVQGSLTKAARLYGDMLGVTQKLASCDPGNTMWQRDLSASYNSLGDVAMAQGNLTEAARLYGDMLEVTQKLATRDPGNTQWQHDLSVGYDRLGDVAMAQGNLTEAARLYGERQVIKQEHVSGDPGNTEWQRSLSLGYGKLGDVAQVQGDATEAARLYGEGLAVQHKLLSRDPGNTVWQRDLSVSYGRIGDLALAQGDAIEAARLYGEGLAVQHKLLSRDPCNTGWLRDLSVSYIKLGDVALALANLTEAARLYGKGLMVRQELASRDPSNTEWQRSIWMSHWRLGSLCEQQENAVEAARHWKAAYDTLSALVERGVHVSAEDKKALEFLRERVGKEEAVSGK